jgi:hypothetical protein
VSSDNTLIVTLSYLRLFFPKWRLLFTFLNQNHAYLPYMLQVWSTSTSSIILILSNFVLYNVIVFLLVPTCRSQWPGGLRRSSTASRLLRSWDRIPLGVWMSVCCECCVLSGRGLCDELITRPEESYRLFFVVCDLEKQTSWMSRPKATTGLSRQEKKTWYLLAS